MTLCVLANRKLSAMTSIANRKLSAMTLCVLAFNVSYLAKAKSQAERNDKHCESQAERNATLLSIKNKGSNLLPFSTLISQ
jgi:hypothetical protein